MNSLYNQDEKVAIDRSPSDALLLINSADRSSSTSATGQPLAVPLTQPYNNFRLQKPQNMVQGGFTRLKLTEVNFPYAIPNVNDYTNSFWVLVQPVPGGPLIGAEITVPNNFYYGSTLAFVTQGKMNLTAALSTSIGVTWNIDYVPNDSVAAYNGGFNINAYFTATPDTGVPFALYPGSPADIGTKPIPKKSLLTVMGFNPLTNWNYMTSLTTSKFSLYAPMSYTSFVDVVSKKLTYFQKVADGTTNVNGQSEVICRIYIADEISLSPQISILYTGGSPDRGQYQTTLPVGSAPYLIHRQFMCPKSFRWNENTAIDWFDIALYDDVGQPLYIDPDRAYPDFQITMKCTED